MKGNQERSPTWNPEALRFLALVLLEALVAIVPVAYALGHGGRS